MLRRGAMRATGTRLALISGKTKAARSIGNAGRHGGKLASTWRRRTITWFAGMRPRGRNAGTKRLRLNQQVLFHNVADRDRESTL